MMGERSGATKTDITSTEWCIDDEPSRLREWATDIIHPFPEGSEIIVGSDPDCAIRLRDPRVSHHHLRLVHEGTRWIGYDLGSKNGVRVDRLPRDRFLLHPGLELRIGGVTLVVESPRLIALRNFLRRVVGLASSKTEVAEFALAAVRFAALRRTPLALCGVGDLVPLAEALHRHTHRDRPFVTCKPSRKAVGKRDANVRYAVNYASGLEALEAAKTGTICVSAARSPDDFDDLLAALRRPDAQTQLIVCATRPGATRAARTWASPIVVPKLSTRVHELPTVIEEYGAEAIASLSVATTFTAIDRDWIAKHSASSLPESELGTRRLMALRAAGSVARAAQLLGMVGHSALQEWIDRRRLPSETHR